MSFFSWLRENFGRPHDLPELPDPHAAHAATERSRHERRRTVQRRRELLIQLKAMEKEIEILRDRRGWR